MEIDWAQWLVKALLCTIFFFIGRSHGVTRGRILTLREWKKSLEQHGGRLDAAIDGTQAALDRIKGKMAASGANDEQSIDK